MPFLYNLAAVSLFGLGIVLASAGIAIEFGRAVSLYLRHRP